MAELWIVTCITSTACWLLYVLILRNPNVVLFHKQETKVEACRRIGIWPESNLEDEHDSQYSAPAQDGGENTWRIKSLWIYPIKSCTGVELRKGIVTGRGMEFDRQFCFAQLTSKFPVALKESREEKGMHIWKFITQRTFPAMARIKTEIWIPDPSTSTYAPDHPNVKSEGVLALKFPSPGKETRFWGRLWGEMNPFSRSDETTVHIPLNPTKAQTADNDYAIDKMEIWKDSPASLIMATTESPHCWIHELRSFLGITNHLALFRACAENPRKVYRCAPRQNEIGYQSTVSFQDAYPLHVLSLASVHDVAKNMEGNAPPIGARNFRPNIVITGGGAYVEESWKRIKIGDFEFYVACRTVRCLLPNVNPATGVRHGSEPNRTLKSFRRIDEGDPKNACLGMQMVPAKQESEIEVGDTITVCETGEHFYIKQ